MTSVDAPESPVAADGPSTSVTSRWLSVLVGTVVAVSATWVPSLGLAVAIVGVLGATGAALRHTGQKNQGALNSVLLAGAVLSAFLVVRDNRWLAWCVVASCVAIVVLASSATSTNQALFDYRIGRTLRAWRGNPTASGASGVRGTLVQPAMPGDSAFVIVRGLTLALVVVTIFWSLLASADEVFAAIVDIGRLPAPRIALGFATTAAIGGLFALVHLGRSTEGSTARRRLRSIESTIVLGAVAALFGVFVAVRLGRLGAPLSEDAWRSEVRSGFFQLLFVAALTVVLILTLRRHVALEGLIERRRFRRLATFVVALAAAIDVIALQRIAEYVERNFQTPLRWWSFGFGLLLVIVLGLVLVRIHEIRPDAEWMTGALLCAWLAFVFAMGLSNPDQRIAQYNFEHPREVDGVISVRALSWLSEDATPEIVTRLDALRPLPNSRFERMVAHLCETDSTTSWREWNVARIDAESARAGLCQAR